MHDQTAGGPGTGARRRLVEVAVAFAVLASVLGMGPNVATAGAGEVSVERVAGVDRYRTAVAVANRSWPDGADTVFLAAGGVFADALAAGPAAALEDAPILLTGRTQLPDVTSGALSQLRPAAVVVLGGPAAVSDTVLEQVRAVTGADVERVAGADRYATAAAVASRAWPDGADTVYLAAAGGFADALAAGPVAAAHAAPILLTGPDELPRSTAVALSLLGADRVVIVGGSDAVPEAIADVVGVGRSVTRVAGADRYETAAALAAGLPSGTAPSFYLATGVTFPDALAATPAAAREGAAILLSATSCLPAVVAEAVAASTATGVVVLGGEQALGPGVAALTPCGGDGDPSSPNEATGSCLGGTEPTMTIAGAQSTRTRLTGLGADVTIDAATAVWEQVHDWPVHIEAGPRLCLHGGTIRGTYTDDTSWDTLHSTGAVNIFAPAATIEDLRIHNYGDGIRILDGADGFTIRRAHLSYVRDDCIENDDVYAGTVTDSLLDGCYVAFSARPWQDDHPGAGTGQVWAITGNVVRLQPMPTVYRGAAPGHGGFFKWDPRGPKMSLHDNVFRADQDSNHTTMGIPEGSLADCSNNVMVWLGEGPYPEVLPDCFTITTDRTVWDAAVAAWHLRR